MEVARPEDRVHIGRPAALRMPADPEDPHVEALRPAGDRAADLAQPHHRERLALEQHARMLGLPARGPAGLEHRLVLREELLGQAEHQRQGVLGDRDGVGAAGVRHLDAAPLEGAKSSSSHPA